LSSSESDQLLAWDDVGSCDAAFPIQVPTRLSLTPMRSKAAWKMRPSIRPDYRSRSMHQHGSQIPVAAFADAQLRGSTQTPPCDGRGSRPRQFAPSPLDARGHMVGQVMQLPRALQRPGQSKGPRRPRYPRWAAAARAEGVPVPGSQPAVPSLIQLLADWWHGGRTWRFERQHRQTRLLPAYRMKWWFPKGGLARSTWGSSVPAPESNSNRMWSASRPVGPSGTSAPSEC